MKDAYTGTFAALTGTSLNEIELITNSRDQEFLTGRVLHDEIVVISENGQFVRHETNRNLSELDAAEEEKKEAQEQEEKIFQTPSQIASITKTFTAVALTQMAADEKYSEFFNQEDPMGTTISSFEDLINKHAHPNVQLYWRELKQNHPNYNQITLRHLLNHSSGIAGDGMKIFSELGFRDNQNQDLHIESHYDQPEIAAENFGKMSYCNFSYDIVLRPLMESVASEVANQPVQFSEIIKAQIIYPLGLMQTFMPDEMGYDAKENRVIVKERPDIAVAQGYDYHNGKVQPGQDFNYDKAAGGIYSTAQDISKFYQALAGNNPQLLNERGIQLFFDKRNFISSDEPTNPNVENTYGLGVRRSQGLGQHQGTEFFHHGGAGLGFYSHVIAQRQIGENGEVVPGSVKTATTLLAYENLTLPIAAALLGNEKKDKKGRFFVDEELAKKMNELAQNHSLDQLIVLRNQLEDFRTEDLKRPFEQNATRFQEFYKDLQQNYQESPSTSPEKGEHEAKQLIEASEEKEKER